MDSFEKCDRELQELIDEGALSETGDLRNLDPLIEMDHIQLQNHDNTLLVEKLDRQFDKLVADGAFKNLLPQESGPSDLYIDDSSEDYSTMTGEYYSALIQYPKQAVQIPAIQAETEVKDKEIPPVQDEEDPGEITNKRHLNVVIIGHVDAGKYTTEGQIFSLSGQVDEWTIQKYEKEAKDKSIESWYMAYIRDTNEERAKVKKVEVGRVHFETETTRFTILDAPGDENYVPDIISGASQADVGVLVISARKGEFERGGQTNEHAHLAKTLGVAKLLLLVNKMDDPTVKWSKERYDEIESKMTLILKQSGYYEKKDVTFLPISGLGTNIKTRVEKSICPWWNGPSLFEALDAIEVSQRDS